MSISLSLSLSVHIYSPVYISLSYSLSICLSLQQNDNHSLGYKAYSQGLTKEERKAERIAAIRTAIVHGGLLSIKSAKERIFKATWKDRYFVIASGEYLVPTRSIISILEVDFPASSCLSIVYALSTVLYKTLQIFLAVARDVRMPLYPSHALFPHI